jgi:predicted MFS family arabinose efflux permease
MRSAFIAYPEFMRITRNTLLHGLGIWLASPLYTLFFVRQMNASDAWLGLNGMVASLGTIVGYTFWRSLMARWGEQPTLKRTIVLAGVYPVLVGLMPGLTPILLLSALNGLIVPGINLSHFNTLLRAMPADSRPSFTAVYQTIMNVGAFVSPLLGVALADVIGIGPALVVSGLLSIIGSTSFIWWPVVKE